MLVILIPYLLNDVLAVISALGFLAIIYVFPLTSFLTFD